MSTDLRASESLFGGKGSHSTLEQSRDFQIMFEYETLIHYAPNGVIVIPDMKSIHIWYGIVFIRSGIYKDQAYKFLIDMPYDYPNSAPKVTFISPVFHPLIDLSTYELNLTPKFPVWRPKKDFVFMILRYIKNVFIQKNFWTEKDSKNHAAFVIKDEEIMYMEEMIKTSRNKMDNKKHDAWIYRVTGAEENEDTRKVLEAFKKIHGEEDLNNFFDWLDDKYTRKN
ncbi:hypothetical protein SteCoe_18488 [Stentor coeruleus]|uniref:UBC core domain-containing protein n=1 Tax=Stentor coeruleus TaxID=5963 RepID=A0A1R2BWZ1_9CILI|nr:hypothetical protein SteCoe_18488 [Stentor coeruleus]